MGFGGSVQAMIISLKNNARKKKIAFSNWKEDKNIFHFKNRSLIYKTLPKEELDQLKKEIRTKAAKENERLIISVTIICIPILFLIYFMVQNRIDNFQKEQRIEAIKKQKKIDEIIEVKEKRILHFLEDGARWLNKGHYKNAKTQFYNAYKIESEDYRINYANAKVYVLDCIENDVGCNTANRIVIGMKEKYGNTSEIVELELLLEQK